jgi:hypothetical protein
LMGLRKGKVIFLADAEAEDSKAYSPPGTIYPETTPTLLEVFEQKTATTEGAPRGQLGRMGFRPRPGVGSEDRRSGSRFWRRYQCGALAGECFVIQTARNWH